MKNFDDFYDNNISLKNVFSEAWKIYQKAFSTFIPLGLCYGFSSIFDRIIQSAFDSNAFTIILLVNTLISSWFSIAVIQATTMFYLGKEMSFSEALKCKKPSYWTFVVITLTVASLIGLGFMMFILPGIYLATILLFADIVVVLENRLFLDSIRRSYQIAQPYFWKVLGFCLILSLFFILPSMLMLGKNLFNMSPALNRGLQLLCVILLFPFYTICQVVLFHKLVPYIDADQHYKE
ncbi:MAG: hypothetical protein KC713_09340 [Candidatus Omnitrophica bacterium]|nr:hypothetical protein [Candidatus Omnitrophota bacterium]